MVVVVLLAALAGVALLWQPGGPASAVAEGGVPPPTTGTSPPPTPTVRPDVAAAAALPAVDTAAAADTSVPALQARDERRRAAVARFHGTVLAELNRCLPQRPGPRSPQELVVHFVAAEPAAQAPGAAAAVEAFKVSAIEPVGVAPGQPSPRETPAWACFEGLSGTRLEIPAGAGKQPAQFRELMTLPLPASVGWAHAGVPGARIP